MWWRKTALLRASGDTQLCELNIHTKRPSMQWSAIVAWLDAFDAAFCLLQPIGNNDQSKRVYIYRMIFGAVNGHIFFPECCCSWKASFPSRSSWIDVFIEHVFLYLYSWMLIHKLLYISQANDQFYWIPEIFEVSTNIEANIIFHWHWYEYSLCKCTEQQFENHTNGTVGNQKKSSEFLIKDKSWNSDHLMECI